MVHDVLLRLFAHAALYRMALGREHGLNPFRLLSMLLIGGSQTGVSIKALREALVIPGSSLTFTLDSLEKKGLVRRARSKTDRRQWLVSLTAKGRRFCAGLVERDTEAVMPSLEKFSDDERAAFFKVAAEISQAGVLQGR
jgi:MarR family 2-MHQ and catechol resistance regulon transcriptional repressor